ncbi:rho guanine nucleotide exchange factor 11-like isoform X48 [Ostrea edulis]|uniref:rho guanine nucleotide exchange factor 11-like isoform X48 n=1 Tax=Ostrea edulis TaxID=37623 RepID=UPI0024AF69B5|nr:rho guanine nucleotide exchange factor 11-like isoform X48 [Ostrea edulis]
MDNKMEENVHPEGYNSLPLRRKNCKKYRRASEVLINKRQFQDGRLCTSVYGTGDHMTGQKDSGPFVALTLMNKTPEKVTKPIPVDSRKSAELQAFKLSEIKKYYDNATEELQRTKAQLQNNPSDEKLASKVKEQEALVKKLEDQIKAQAAEESPEIGNGEGSIAPWGPAGPVSDGSSVSDSPTNSPNASPTPTHPNNSVDTQSVQRKDVDYDEISQTSLASSGQQQRQIIAAEEDEFSSDEDMQNKTDDYGPFNDLRQLETKPTHMSVFLNFVLKNESPSALLFYITTHVFHQAKGGIKELQKWAFEIFSTFLANGAPLKVKIDQALVDRIDDSLNFKSSEKEDLMRTIFNGARNFVQMEISNSLQEFRSKLSLGFGSMYGLQLVLPNMKQKDEAEVALKILSPYLEKVPPSDEDIRPDQTHVMAWAVATFLRHNGIMDKKHSSMERVQSFVAKEKKKPLIQRKRTFKAHSFQPQHFSRVENCIHCKELIWGVGFQAYQCSNCEQWIHKYCLDSLEEFCPKKKRNRPLSTIKPVSSTTEAPSPSPVNPTIQPVKDEPEEFPLKHTVDTLIKKYDPVHSEGPSGRKKSPSVEDMTNNDVEIDDNVMKAITGNSPSSSSSSIRSGESPSNSMDAVNNIPHTIENDSDFEVENELPPLESIYPKDVYKKLRPKDRKRLEVINELFYTERTHCRNLKILQNLFFKPMSQDPNISQDLIKVLFPNLDKMIALHGSMNSAMKDRKKSNSIVTEVGDILLARFDTEGEAFRNGCAEFCQNQSYALDFLRARQRKDTKLSNFLNEAESSPLMRRLQLRDLIPTQMMRLTKYPLLIENLMKYTQTSTEEHSRLERALALSKSILAYVNQAVKDCENSYKLKILQRKIDRKQMDHHDFKELDLTKHKLMLEGVLTWNINQRKSVDCHVVLLEDLLVLFQKQDDKLVLRQQSTQLVAGKEDSRYQFSPLLKLENVLHTNSKATDKKAFFVVSKTQIYELSTSSTDEQKKWIRHIKEAADSFKKRKDKAQEPAKTDVLAVEPPQIIRRPSAERAEDELEEELIQPDEITVQNPLSQKAEPVLTPLEKIRRLDETMQEHLQEKTVLVAEVLNIPTAEVPQRLQMVEEMPGNANMSDAMLALSDETQKYLVMLNSAESGLVEEELKMPLPMEKLREMANRMNQILTNLLEKTRQYAALNAGHSPASSSAVVNSRDEERERLRLELKAAQEELNMLREIQRRVSGSNSAALAPVQGRPQSFISDASSYSDTEAVANTEEEEIQDVQSDHNEAEVDAVDVPDDLDDFDPEASEPEVSVPTRLPIEIIDTELLCVSDNEPPEEESVVEPEPPCVPEEELTGAKDTKTEEIKAEDGVQKAEINLIEEVTEEVTEFSSNQKDVIHSGESDIVCKDTTKEEEGAKVLPKENPCEDPGGLSAEKGTVTDDERRFSNDDYEDAVETQSEIREDSEQRTNNEGLNQEQSQEEIMDQEKTDVGKEGAESDVETADKQNEEVVEDREKCQIIEDKLSEKLEEKILDNDDNENNLESTNTTDNKRDSGSPV